MDPLPRTRNRFLAPLFVLTPPLNRRGMYRWRLLSEVGDDGDGNMDDLGDNVVDADSVEVVEYPALLVVEGIHRRRMLFDPQFHNNDILMFFVFDNSGVGKC